MTGAVTNACVDALLADVHADEVHRRVERARSGGGPPA